MPDYEKMYFGLFNKVTEAIMILQKAQMNGEDGYISDEDAPPVELTDFKNPDE